MTGNLSKPPFDWACHQINKYRDVHPRYQRYADALRQVLEDAARHLAPLAVVQTRPKAIASFAEKIQRKWPKTDDPINQFTDLCGGRVITFTQPEVKTVCEFIQQHFEIDWENSAHVSQRSVSEFGYRSVHYIVRFKPGVFPTKDVAVTVPDEVMGLEAQIEVHASRTRVGRLRTRSGLQERVSRPWEVAARACGVWLPCWSRPTRPSRASSRASRGTRPTMACI